MNLLAALIWKNLLCLFKYSKENWTSNTYPQNPWTHSLYNTERVSDLSATLHRYEKHMRKVSTITPTECGKCRNEFTFHKADDPSSLNIVLRQSETPLYWFPAPCQMSKRKMEIHLGRTWCSFSIVCVHSF